MISKLFRKHIGLFASPLNTFSAAQVSFNTKEKKKPPVRVAVTGAAGQIGYALLFRIASGQMLGPNQPVILQLVDLPFAMNALQVISLN
jgi:hypothetical protein